MKNRDERRYAPPPLEAGRGDVHVTYWRTDGLADRELAAADAELTREERARRSRFHFAKDRRDFTAAHALLRRALSTWAPRPTRDWVFVDGPHGKPRLTPELADQTGLCFNISHTDGLVACAVARDADIGIDVESIDRRADVLNLARHYFSPPEIAQLERCPQPERHARFIDIWTLKEAFVKATGDGFFRRLDEFAFVIDGTTPSFEPLAGAHTGAWQFALFQPSEDHRLAIAIRDPRPVHRPLTINDHQGPTSMNEAGRPAKNAIGPVEAVATS